MTQSFNNQTVDQVSLTLARRQVALRHGLDKPMTKLGYSLSDAFKGVGDWYKARPHAMQKAIQGAGIGGVLGLGSNLFRDQEERHLLRDAVTGAIAGGALGGGYGLATQGLKGVNAKPKDGPSAAEAQEALTNIQKLEDQAKPSLLHDAGNLVKENPYTSAIGGAAALDTAVGTTASALGKNISPSAFRDLSKSLREQVGAGKDAANTPIGQSIKALFKNETKSKQVLADLMSGHPEKLKALSRNPSARAIMQSMRGQMPVRPMTATQWAMQNVPKKMTGPLSRIPGVTRFGRAIPKSLPRPPIPKSKGGAIAAIAALLGAGYLGKEYMNSEAAQRALHNITGGK